MKRIAWTVATLLLAGSVTAALGQGGDGGAGDAGGAGGAAGGGGAGRAARGQMGGGQAGNFGGRGGGQGAGAAIQQYVNQYETMLAQVNLTEEQKPKVKAKVDAMISELQTYQQNAMQSGGGRGQRGARGAGGGGGGMSPQMAKMRDELQELANEHQVKINAELTLDQRYTWEHYKLNRVLQPRLQQVSLSEEQSSRIKSATEATVKSLIALTDGKEIPTLYGKLYRQIVGEILTEDQAGRMLETGLLGPAGGRGFGGGNAAGANDGAGPGGGFGRGQGGGGQGGGRGQGAGGQGGGRGGQGGGRGNRGGGGAGLP